ncbi:MAG: tetratricopeptide repeat protein [Rhodospirillales bacterium]
MLTKLFAPYKLGLRLGGGAAVMAAALGACTSVDTQLAVEKPAAIGATMAGNYLAGRHAQTTRDMAAATNFYDAALKVSPSIPGLLRRTFVLMVVEGRIEEAAPLARKITAINPDDVIANLVLVVHDIRSERYAEADERLDGMPENGINTYMIPLFRAWTRIGLGQGAGPALEALSPLSEKDGSKALYSLHAALLNDAAGRPKEAEKHYLEAIENQGGMSFRLVELLGAHYERSGLKDKAKEIYQKYLEAHPGTSLLNPSMARLEAGDIPGLEVATPIDGAAEGLFGMSSSLSQQNARETALVFGRMALFLKPDFPVMQVMVGEILEAETRLESANGIYTAIDVASPFSWAARLNTAFNLNKLEKTEEAVALLKVMAEANPAKPDPLINLGDILRGHERFAEAVETYDKAIARIPELTTRHWSLLYSRGIALEQSKQWDRAEADFLKALEFQPDQPYVLNYLGYSWVDQGKNLDRAKKMIEKAVELRPNDGYIVDSLGWVLYRLGEFEESVPQMERATLLRPEDPVINDHLGDAYWRVGRRYEARFQWNRALSFDPGPDIKAEIETKIKSGLKAQAKPGTDG